MPEFGEGEGFLSRVTTNIAGTLSEAWSELRTHKLRVILSLIGIAVAVAALTAVVGLGELQKQSTLELNERWGGRIATIRVDTTPSEGSPIDWIAEDARFEQVNERYSFTHTTRLIDSQVMLPVQLPEGVFQIPSKQFDPAYPVIHRIKLAEGRWFRSGDEALLAPPVVISAPLWERLGSPPIDTHPLLEMTNEHAGKYQIIGVTPKMGDWDQELRVDMLFESFLERVGVIPKTASVSREIWVGADQVAEIGVRRSFGASGSRIFASVMMESVVATAVAGILGITLAVALVRSPLVMDTLFFGLQDVPPFPFSAALIGLVAAVLTGALAGLVPAIVATRVRVIDAIRY